MSQFNSIKELLNTMSRGNKLIAEMFEKRKIEEIKLNQLIIMIHEYKRGLEQEVFIKCE